MRQSPLFPTQVIPEGLVFEPDFLSREEERELLSVIQGLPFLEFRLHGVTAKRRVMHFGFRYALEKRVLSNAPEPPPEFEPLRARAGVLAGVPAEDFSQILVNQYPPGAGIGWHHDSPPFGIVAGISLGADCTMRFQADSGEQRRTADVELPQNNRLRMTAPSVIQEVVTQIKSMKIGTCEQVRVNGKLPTRTRVFDLARSQANPQNCLRKHPNCNA